MCNRLKLVLVFFCLGLLILPLSNCVTPEEDDPENPVPILNSVSPTSRAGHMPSFVLTVTGEDFVEDSVIVFNGAHKTTIFHSDTTLSCSISSDDIPAASLPRNNGKSRVTTDPVSVLVRSPIPGGGDSVSVSFAITDNPTFHTPVSLLKVEKTDFFTPQVASDSSGNLSILYKFMDNASGIQAIDYIRSTDSGSSWSDPVRLVQSVIGVNNPKIAIDAGGNINTVFSAEGVLYFLRSTDNGTSWSSPKPLSTVVSSEALEPAIVVDSNNYISVIWPQKNANWNYPVYFIRSTDNGLNWTQPVNIFQSFQSASSAYNVQLAVYGSNDVFASWIAWPTGASRYSYANFNYSHNGGSSWNGTDTSFGICSATSMKADIFGNVDLVLASSYIPFADQIIFRQSIDLGVTWPHRSDITSNRYDRTPLIAIDSLNNKNVIYQTNSSTYYCRSIDNGVTWSQETTIASDASVPSITVDPWGNIFLVYEYGSPAQLWFLKSR